MKKFCWAAIIFCLLSPSRLIAQAALPSYLTVLQHFFKSYSYTPEEVVDGLNFAKKKDGWYVQVIDHQTEIVKQDQLFWSAQTGIYLKLNNFEEPLTKEEAAEQVLNFSQTNRYAYERCRYFGYNSWDWDMIQDFGKSNQHHFSDTLIDGLARAHSNYASRFLWYQLGGLPLHNNPLQQKLSGLEMPSKQRIDSVIFYFNQALGLYEQLAKKNPSYPTVVGNPVMKIFNEQMHAFSTLQMAGYDDEANTMLATIKPDPELLKIARNYLDNCDPNSILFTYGDNDTYPLWYAQQAHNIRKDVAVINTSLLGLPYYADLLTRKKIVSFSTLPKYYTQPGFAYSLLQDHKTWAAAKPMPLPTFLSAVQTKKYQAVNDATKPPIYPTNLITFTIDPIRFKKLYSQTSIQPAITFELQNYLTSDEFLMLDILNANVYKRPVYLTHDAPLFKPFLQQEGPNFRLIPIDFTKSKTDHSTTSIKKIETYLNKVHQPLQAADKAPAGSVCGSPDYLGSDLYYKVAKYYFEKEDKAATKQWLIKLLSKYNNELPFSFAKKDIGLLLIQTGDSKKGLQLIEEAVEHLYHMHQNPSATNFYLHLEVTKNYIAFAKAELKQLDLSSEKINTISEKLNTEE